MSAPLSLNGRSWCIPEQSGGAHSGFIEQLLQNRGVNDVEAFLHPTIRDLMPDPACMPDIQKAAETLMLTLNQQGGISILADFDVDGATSAALLFQYCRFFGVRPLVEVPERLTEGFGPNRRILDTVAGRNSDLLLCLDCGTAAVELFADYADKFTTIIVDHHQPEHNLPDVFAVVNPQASDAGRESFADLAAVGVVFMLLVVTNQCFKAAGHAVPDLKKTLDLVALGTVCDMVPMRGLNRAITHRGIELMKESPSTGLAALLPASSAKTLQTEDLSFTIGPKLNAGSRMGFSSLPWQLLVEEDATQARALARRLSGLNNKRKAESLSLAAVAESVMLEKDHFLFASGEGWPLGILGILAGRLSRRHHKPTLIVSYNAEGMGSGSARSVAGVDLAALFQLAVAEGVLDRGGGHAMAGGFGLKQANEATFVAFITDALSSRTVELPPRQVDAVIQVGDCNWNFYTELKRLEPFGVGNPEPLFQLEDVKLHNVALMGTEHLRAQIINDRQQSLNMVMFSEANSPLGKALQAGHQQRYDLLVRLKPDFRLRGKVTAHLEDARLR